MSVKAFILAAGLGTRLLPLSAVFPKPAWPFFDVSIACRLVEGLIGAGVGEFIVNLQHQPDRMREALEPCLKGRAKVAWSYEKTILGTGGALVPWLEELQKAPFILANADTYRAFDPALMLSAHRSSGADATLSLSPLPEGEKGPVEIDGEGRIVRFIDAVAPGAGKGVTVCEFTGMHILNPFVAAEVGRAAGGRECFCINKEVHRRLVAGGACYMGYLPEDDPYWCDLGTPQSYLGAHFSFLSRGALPGGAGGRLILSDISLPGGAQALAPSYLGEGAEIGEGARVGPYAVVGAGAKVAGGVAVERSVVWAGGQVLEDAAWEIVSTAGMRMGGA